ncbi:hypothetical protein FRB98_001378 [Tulasnella sp. 332]|nr:hypothetical protein FRB98_001378 [Tulasnella sp. 332]
MSACATCQGGNYATFVTHHYSPSSYTLVLTPRPPPQLAFVDRVLPAEHHRCGKIPPETAIPVWAYQDPTSQPGDTFNLTLAQATAEQKLPDVTTKSTQKTTTASKSGIGVGAIVGIVLGGLAFATLLAYLTWFLLRMRHSSRASQAPSKQYISKWSKDVLRAGEGPPRSGGGRTTSRQGSSDGKSRDMMMATQVTPPEPMAYGSDGYFRSGNQSGQQSGVSNYNLPRTSDVSGRPSAAASNTSPSPPNSSSKIRQKFGSPQTHAAITPFYLPPINAPTSDNYTVASSGGSTRAGSHTPIVNPTESSQSASAHRRQISPPELPSSIEYLSSNRTNVPPMPPSSFTIARVSENPVSAGGAPSTRSRRGSGSTGGGRTNVPYPTPQGYYNPDDPATYPLTPIEQNLFNQPPSARQSDERVPLGSSTFMPRSSERLPLNVTNAAPPTPQVPSYAYTHPDAHGGSGRPYPIDTDNARSASGAMPPEYSGSPGSTRGMMGSFGTDVKVQPREQQQSSPAITRGHDPLNNAAAHARPLPTTPSPLEMAARSMVPVGQDTNAGWTPHARNQQEAESEFNPWGGARQ